MKAVRNGLLTLTVAALCAACQNNEAPAPKQSTAEAPAQTGSGLKIAFVLIDTLTNQYELYKDAQEKFQKKQANAENTINEKGKNFAAQVQSFQNRVQKNQITQEEYNNEQARLGKFQQDIQDLQTRLSNTLQEEYAKELQTLTDTIQSFMKSYAKEKGYDFILCKSSGIDQVLYADEAYDVTEEIETK